MNRTFDRELITHLGTSAAASHVAFRALNPLTRLKIYRGLVVTMQTVDRRLSGNTTGQFLTRDALVSVTREP